MSEERRLAEALRAHAAAGAPPPVPPSSPQAPPEPPRRAPLPPRWVVTIALLAGAVCGAALAVTASLVPGLLP